MLKWHKIFYSPADSERYVSNGIDEAHEGDEDEDEDDNGDEYEDEYVSDDDSDDDDDDDEDVDEGDGDSEYLPSNKRALDIDCIAKNVDDVLHKERNRRRKSSADFKQFFSSSSDSDVYLYILLQFLYVIYIYICSLCVI